MVCALKPLPPTARTHMALDTHTRTHAHTHTHTHTNLPLLSALKRFVPPTDTYYRKACASTHTQIHTHTQTPTHTHTHTHTNTKNILGPRGFLGNQRGEDELILSDGVLLHMTLCSVLYLCCCSAHQTHRALYVCLTSEERGRQKRHILGRISRRPHSPRLAGAAMLSNTSFLSLFQKCLIFHCLM